MATKPGHLRPLLERDVRSERCHELQLNKFLRATSYLNGGTGLLRYVTTGYMEPSSHYLGNWEP